MSGGAAAAAGALIWIDAIVGRVLLRADDVYVYFMGHPVAWTCWLRSHYGVPCPTCGLSRGLVLSLHGRWLEAWRLFPAAPAAVAGGLALATAMLVLAGFEASGRASDGARWRRMRAAALVWAGAVTMVWIGGWLAAVML